jgi:FtsH-binding integral membrane protein
MNNSIDGSIATTTQIDIINQAFIWMATGLGITAMTGMFVAGSPALQQFLFSNSLILYILLFGEIGLVLFLSFRITALSFGAALLSFFGYAILNGLTLSVVFLAYTQASIASTFLATASLFGAMAVYGYTTKRDLTTIGNLAFMALIGVILASVVNIFLRSDAFSYILSYIAIFVFIGLTAYDTQKLKKLSRISSNPNLGILGALTLYLDFINLFLNLLRILGRRRS